MSEAGADGALVQQASIAEIAVEAAEYTPEQWQQHAALRATLLALVQGHAQPQGLRRPSPPMWHVNIS